MMNVALTATDPVSRALTTERRLVIRQHKSWGEILTGFEAKSRYQICTDQGEMLGQVGDVSGGLWATLGRWFFKGRRPFELLIESAGATLLVLKRPWFWFFSTLEIQDGGGRPVGRVEQRFGILRRRFEVFDASGRRLAWIIGPLFHPWTFVVHEGAEDGREVGRIEKRWSGLGKEMFSDADNFLVTLPPGNPELARMVLASALLMDFCYFENKGSNEGLLGTAVGLLD